MRKLLVKTIKVCSAPDPSPIIFYETHALIKSVYLFRRAEIIEKDEFIVNSKI